jgi:peptidoglycan hydrolase-like protein with peptidoglycan-binding domain
MGTAAGMIAEAKKHVGLGEKPNNTNYMTKWYGASGTPWCVIAVTYVAHHSDNAAAIFNRKFASCRVMIDAFKKHGRWHDGLSGIAPGDVVFFQLDSDAAVDHVGIVRSVSGSSVGTYEGNTSNEFRDRSYATSNRGNKRIVGYGRPAYGGGGGEGNLGGGGGRGELGGGTLSVDGAFGPKTKAALQASLNAHGASLTVDGVFGSQTKRALQRYLGVSADGAVGPITVKALQRKVGATVDGDWGPNTTKALQRALNAGRF